MKIRASELLKLKKISSGYHLVKIIEITDQQKEIDGNIIDYIDIVFFGADGFIIRSFFNLPSEQETLIRLFKVCNIKTPLNYKISTSLLWHKELIIKVENFTDLHGNNNDKVTEFYRDQNIEKELDLPESIEVRRIYHDIFEAPTFILFQHYWPIDDKYKYTNHLR